MAPYQESVIEGGTLEVWTTEWEVTWRNDRPRTLSGSPDLRYSYFGTRFTRAQIVALVESLPGAWQAAEAAAVALGASAGAFRKPAPGGPITIVVDNGRPALVIKDFCRLASDAAVERAVRELESLVRHADAKQVEIHRLFNP
jgi:hypothetical protein